MTPEQELIRSLIHKHLNGWHGLKFASIQHYAESGNVSGSLFLAIIELMVEYAEEKKRDLTVAHIRKLESLYKELNQKDAEWQEKLKALRDKYDTARINILRKRSDLYINGDFTIEGIKLSLIEAFIEDVEQLLTPKQDEPAP